MSHLRKSSSGRSDFERCLLTFPRASCPSSCCFPAVPPLAAADKSGKPESPQLAALNSYFEQQVSSLEGQLERDIKTKEDWLAKKDEYRRQLAEMLGLDPMPPRTDLHATNTGEFEHEGIIVENLHFQSMPGLYVTGEFVSAQGRREAAADGALCLRPLAPR